MYCKICQLQTGGGGEQSRRLDVERRASLVNCCLDAGHDADKRACDWTRDVGYCRTTATVLTVSGSSAAVKSLNLKVPY